MVGRRKLRETKSKYSTISTDHETLRKLRLLGIVYHMDNSNFIKFIIDTIWDKAMASDAPTPLTPKVQTKVTHEARDALKELDKALD